MGTVGTRMHAVGRRLAGLLAAGVAWGLAPAAPALALPDAVNSLAARQWEADPPGAVLFREDFEAGALAAWQADPNWSLVGRGDPPGTCAQVVSADKPEDIQDLVLKQHIPVTPGHPVVVCWRSRFAAGSDPTFLRVDFFDADGKQGQPYARQDVARQGARWTENTVRVSDWFPPYTRAITIWFHQAPKTGTTALLDDIRVVDLAAAAQDLLRQELPRYRQLADTLARETDALPASPLNDAWKTTVRQARQRLAQELDAVAALEPGTPAASEALARPARDLRRFADALAGLRAGTVSSPRLLVYAVRPLTSTMVLPDAADLPGVTARQLTLQACPGETESASLVLWAPEPLPGLLVTAGDLVGPAATVPAANLDLRWVACWYQAGSAWSGVSQDRSRKVLTPELLVHDDALLRVDRAAHTNQLRLSLPEGPRYVAIDDPKPVPWGTRFPVADFPVRDAATLQPLAQAAGDNRQVWLTVRVPAATPAGDYRGTLTLSAAGQPVGTLDLVLRVLPFTLPEPRTHWDLTQPFTFSLYYWGELTPDGTSWIGFKTKGPEQFAAELRLMFEHGIVAPCMIWSPAIVYDNEPLFRRHLQAAKDAGMSGRPLYFGDSGLIGSPTAPEDLAKLAERVRRTLRLAAEYGFTGVYFYGIDEATGDKLRSQRTAWQTVHEAGGKVIVSGFTGQLAAMGDLLDLFNRAGDPAAEDPAAWHQLGHRVWNYAHPQTPPENPELYRRNYGLYLWRADFDGANTYCFMDSSGTPWNDFDDDTYRDHCLAYPTADGVLPTLAIAGLREAADDVRYATALRLRIEEVRQTGTAPQKVQAEAALAWLDSLDTRTVDLDTARQGIVERLQGLR